jgi:hypothetical protein
MLGQNKTDIGTGVQNSGDNLGPSLNNSSRPFATSKVELQLLKPILHLIAHFAIKFINVTVELDFCFRHIRRFELRSKVANYRFSRFSRELYYAGASILTAEARKISGFLSVVFVLGNPRARRKNWSGDAIASVGTRLSPNPAADTFLIGSKSKHCAWS